MRYYLLVFILFTFLCLVLILYASITNYTRKNIYGKNIYGKRYHEKHRFINIRKNIQKKKSEHHQLMNNKCINKCSQKICDEYQTRLKNFSNCEECRLKNKCYSAPQNECVNCSQQDLDTPCTNGELFGCQNPNGYTLDNVPPINPAITKCQPCWENQNNINL